jgi:hypothetical protein
MKKFWITILVVGLLFLGCRAVEPSDEELTLDMQHSSLAGLEGVGVLIRMNPKAKLKKGVWKPTNCRVSQSWAYARTASRF